MQNARKLRTQDKGLDDIVGNARRLVLKGPAPVVDKRPEPEATHDDSDTDALAGAKIQVTGLRLLHARITPCIF